MKAAFTAIIGRPSVGKSTLINAVCGQKVSITAPSPQTTRNTIRGIYSEERGQVVFLDTPGFHDSEKKMNRYLKETALGSLNEIDNILYVVDTTRPPGKEETELMNLLSPRKNDIIAVLNKCDIPSPRKAEIRRLVEENLGPAHIVETSSAKGTGLEELKTLIFDISPDGDPYYPSEYYTDQEPSFRAAEIIRELAINRVNQELPHSIYVEIADMEERAVETASGETKYKLWIRAFLVVEKESQKGILVGKKGAKILEIKKLARKGLEEIFPQRIELDLRVKVNPKWRNKDNLLKQLLS